MTTTASAPTLRLICVYQDRKRQAIQDVDGSDARAMLAGIYPLLSDAHLDESVTELASPLDYAGARVLRFQESWCFLVPITDTRTFWEVIRDAGAAGV